MFPTAHFSFLLQRFSGKCCIQVYSPERPTTAQVFLTFIFENDVNVPSKINEQKNREELPEVDCYSFLSLMVSPPADSGLVYLTQSRRAWDLAAPTLKKLFCLYDQGGAA
jgi:hypothetical protein